MNVTLAASALGDKVLCQQSGEDLCILLLVVALPERLRETLSKTVAFGGSALTYGEAGNSV